MPLRPLSQGVVASEFRASPAPPIDDDKLLLLAPTPRPKSILKGVGTPIRVASSVDEGTRSNNEEARAGGAPGSGGGRPPMMTRDTFGQVVRRAGEPSSDSSASDGSSEYEPGTSAGVAELLEVIIDDASDYYAIEDAYHQLQARLRVGLDDAADDEKSPRDDPRVDDLVAPLRDQSTRLLGALKRHVSGVMAPAPTAILDSSSPIQPRLPLGTPSPSPSRIVALRKGFSEAEVQARRAASLAGQQALRFIALLLHHRPLHAMYSDADLTALLSCILVIPFSPRLNTPNPKKTYPLAIYPLSHVRVPAAAVAPLVDRILNAVLDKAIEQSACTWGGQPSPKQGEGGNVIARREGLMALANLVQEYPHLFLPRHADMVPAVLRALSNSSPAVRCKAALAAGALVKAKMSVRRNGARELVSATESTAASFFLRPSLGRSWLEFSDALAKAFTLHYGWASTVWALVVSLLGDQFLSRPILSKPLVKMMLTPLCSAHSQEHAPGRAAISRFAWDHLLHAVVTFNEGESGQFDFEHSFGKARQTAFSLAIGPAHNDAQSPAASIVDGQWCRSDPLGKQKWITYCTSSATSAVFAWSAIAQTDERRTELFDEVLSATLRHMMSVQALDQVKTLAWELLEAIVGDRRAPVDLDRLLHDDLLSCRHITGDTPSNKDDIIERDALAMQDDIKPSDVGGWGEAWVAGRFAHGLGALFRVALETVRGLQDVDAVEWVEVNGRKVVPAPLLRVWSRMLHAARDGSHENLMEIVRIILGVYTAGEPLLPPTIATDPSLARVDLVNVLLDAALDALPSLVDVRLPLSGPDTVRNASVPPVLMGADSNGNPSSIGAMLDKISRTPLHTADDQARDVYMQIFRKLLYAGLGSMGAKLLGDVTNALPGLGGDDETRQCMWRHIAAAWTTHLAGQTAPSRTPTNHTGVILVELLSWPFRESLTVSQWHAGASADEMTTWKSLLATAVERSFQKQIGPNLAVLDPIAAHLEDFNGDDNDRKLSPTTLACLTALVQAMAFDADVYESSAFHDGVNHVPEDFLHLVNETLTLAAMSRQTQALPLVRAVADALASLPAAAATRALEIVDLSCWLDLPQLDVATSDAILSSLLHEQAGEAMISKALFTDILDDDAVLLCFVRRWNARPLGAMPAWWTTRLESLQQRCAAPIRTRVASVPDSANDADVSALEEPSASDTFAPELKANESRKRTPDSLSSDDVDRSKSQRRKVSRALKKRRLSAAPTVDEPEEECIVVASPSLGSQPRLEKSGGIGSTLGNFLTRIPSFFSPSKPSRTLPAEVTPTALLAGERNAWHGPDTSGEREASLEPTQTSQSGSEQQQALPLRLVSQALEHKDELEGMDTEDILALTDKADELKRKAMAILARRMKALEGR